MCNWVVLYMGIIYLNACWWAMVTNTELVTVLFKPVFTQVTHSNNSKKVAPSAGTPETDPIENGEVGKQLDTIILYVHCVHP